mmetsp:Transcript_4625/g.8342  ORF Transcript_4625/g.8342 Transcript_4625/m.8342 type:complete len:1474 (-) Transcript_4625:187-4608(-)
MATLRHPAAVNSVSLLTTAPWKRYAIAAFFVLLYGISLNLWITTAGQPHEWALEEQKRLIKEKAAEIKEKGVSFAKGTQEQKDSELEIDYEALPSKALPGAWSCAFIFFNISLHILFHLMCVWSIGFRSTCLYQPSKRIKNGCFMRVSPLANKGKADICQVEESEVTLKYTFVFQYQTFEYIEPDEEDPDLVGDVSDGGVRLVKPPIDLSWKDYNNAKGLTNSSQVEKAHDRFGQNVFDLPKPTFIQLFKAQLMSPLAIFQFFCTTLWMLDTYWKYTCFSLMSIIGFEASTAFQRLKSMATLRGMSTKSYNVFVYRESKWQELPIEDLLPGDVISMLAKQDEKVEDVTEEKDEKDKEKDKREAQSNLIVPCDCLVLRGSAIVNEATLTGESVPQMKDALGSGSDPAAQVDMFGKHRIHCLFSGTSLIQVTPPSMRAIADEGADKESAGVPPPPNDGIVCFVLRTGFNSSQGELMRMIEFSTQEVGSDKIETALQLLFLLMFALAAAGYVLNEGLKDPTRPTYKTLLRCTLIITSVVPPSLPMQMAFAVHTALMTLLKAGIFCTEPFRVPFAGRVEYCFFDKTGTLTSDQMVAVGIVNSDAHDKKPHKDSTPKAMCESNEASTMAAMCAAGCHSLIEVEGKAIGDPIEVAALQGVQWSYTPEDGTASPGAWRAKELYLVKQKEYVASLRDDSEADKKEKAEVTKSMEDLEKKMKQEKQDAKKLQVVIEQRFHFSSELQRMSTICKVKSSGSERTPAGVYCLTKGSPEAIARLIKDKPAWYDSTYTSMAEKGQRVLALAYRHLDSDAHTAAAWGKKNRDDIEHELSFAGFASFKCETRKDSNLVVKALQDSSHHCVMLTGDAPLTALSVAFEVGIAKYGSSDALVLTETSDGGLEWSPAITSDTKKTKTREPVKFNPSEIGSLRKTSDLVITGKSLERALAREDAETMIGQFQEVGIYARLSPQQKEQIISAIRKGLKVTTFMCGDGGNDVGALKEADVGLALLSGFGNANVDKTAKKEGKEGELEKQIEDAEAAIEELRKEASVKAQAASKKANEELGRKRKDLMSKQQQWVEEELAARRARGEDVGFMGQMSAMKSVMGRLKSELQKEQQQMQKKHGNAFAAGAAKWAGEMEQMEDTPMVQLGDASTAAPFTSRTPSISATVDIIRQGRCTLLSAVQQMQIMMLDSMIAAYTMSTMSVDGTRPSEAQMMASGSLMSIASLAFSFARPLDRMHKVRPIHSVFHKSALFSMLGQLAVHLGCMVYISRLARDIMGDEKVKEIIEFEKQRNKQIEGMEEDTFNDWNWFMSVPFKNNLLNTCCWLVETSQQISVILVNYKGRPWMKGVLENQPLFLSLFLCIALVAVCAWGKFPYLNELLNLEVIPEDLRMHVMGTLFVSLLGSFCWDRLMIFLFAPEIFQAMMEEIKSVKPADFFPILQTVGYILGGLMFLGMGNPILWGGAYLLYRNYKKGQQPAA